jgi:hypothetical protein
VSSIRPNTDRGDGKGVRTRLYAGQPTNPALPSPGRLHVLSRVAASLLGGYAFVWGLVALGIVTGVAAGMAYDQARTLWYLLAMPTFVVCVCWAFAGRRLARVWAVLAGGGAVMTAAAWLIGRTLV